MLQGLNKGWMFTRACGIRWRLSPKKTGSSLNMCRLIKGTSCFFFFFFPNVLLLSRGYCGLNYLSPRFVCSSSNPQGLSSYLERLSLKRGCS